MSFAKKGGRIHYKVPGGDSQLNPNLTLRLGSFGSDLDSACINEDIELEDITNHAIYVDLIH